MSLWKPLPGIYLHDPDNNNQWLSPEGKDFPTPLPSYWLALAENGLLIPVTTTILPATGMPGSGTGSNGDYAFDLSAGILYGPKTEGAWPVDSIMLGSRVMLGLFNRTVLTMGDAVLINMKGAAIPATVTAYPLDGDTITIQQSLDGGFTYANWALGAVTVQSTVIFDYAITHLRVQRTSGTGIRSAATIC